MRHDQHIVDLYRSRVTEQLTQCRYNYDYAGRRILEIAPDEHESAKATFINAEVTTLSIDDSHSPDVVADLCGFIPFNDRWFDLVICHEVLEHVADPFAAVKEMRRVLKTGGRLSLTTPFMFRMHGPRPDRWRFTEDGLATLLDKFRDVKIVREYAPKMERQKFKELAPLQYITLAKK